MAREAISLWWHDASARELSEGYGGRSAVLSTPLPIGAARALMQPGDMAVTSDGSHVIAVIENETWIQADPVTMRVMQFDESRWWEQSKVIPCRWSLFKADIPNPVPE